MCNADCWRHWLGSGIQQRGVAAANGNVWDLTQRLCNASINRRLPGEFQSEKVTGHSGRHSFTSGGINAGVSDIVMGAATKHKSMESLKRYHHSSESSKVVPALKIAGSAKRRRLVRRIVYDDDEDDEWVGGFWEREMTSSCALQFSIPMRTKKVNNLTACILKCS